MPVDEIDEAFHSDLLALGCVRFAHTIGVEEHEVTGFERFGCDRRVSRDCSPWWRWSARELFYDVAATDQHRQWMTGVGPTQQAGGHVVKQLACAPTPPWGTIARNPTVATEPLEPGDFVLLYTDGVSEAQTPEGEQFGVEGLIDLIDRNASELLRPQQILHTLLHAIRDHRGGDPRDDATFVLFRWEGPKDEADS